MRAPDNRPPRRLQARRSQTGVTIVEFALLVLVFFAFIIGVIDMARLMFLYNTLQETTRRAANGAAVTDPGNSALMDKVRQKAIFRDSEGGLVLMAGLTDRAIRIDYLSVARDASGVYSMQVNAAAATSSEAANRRACLIDPYGPSCVRLVRARVCDPQFTATCEPMKMRSSIRFFNFQIPLPVATTIAKAQSFAQGAN